MAIEINAGDTFDVSCPTGERPILIIGDTLPNEKDILVKVLKIKKETLLLRRGSVKGYYPKRGYKL